MNRVEMLELFPKGGIAAEIGVFQGAYAREIRRVLRPALLYLIDPWTTHTAGSYTRDPVNLAPFERIYEDVRREFSGQDCHIVRMTSAGAALTFDDGFFDFVYIDADHSYEAAFQDLQLWWQKVKVGGVLAGHDYFLDPRHPQTHVKEAVDDWRSSRPLDVLTDDDWDGGINMRSWAFFKHA